MQEHFLAVVGGQETETLVCVEPLDLARGHRDHLSLSSLRLRLVRPRAAVDAVAYEVNSLSPRRRAPPLIQPTA
ncbi:hypothetical protein KVA01_05580 [Kocuria varians]|uniref:Uncharacterized protein n=1 Tax=Kocuria varians TaxID=1272 RepID=A0A4Y4D4B0_KOCVA|nr:hypothetical protein KVA01_05580 [Kocuria varians]